MPTLLTDHRPPITDHSFFPQCHFERSEKSVGPHEGVARFLTPFGMTKCWLPLTTDHRSPITDHFFVPDPFVRPTKPLEAIADKQPPPRARVHGPNEMRAGLVDVGLIGKVTSPAGRTEPISYEIGHFFVAEVVRLPPDSRRSLSSKRARPHIVWRYFVRRSEGVGGGVGEERLSDTIDGEPQAHHIVRPNPMFRRWRNRHCNSGAAR
jgi:hypothetical protein